MRIPLNPSKWYDDAWAAFIFFTRLPLWRLRQPPRESYRAVVEHWPLTGWLTGAVMAATLYFGSMAVGHAVAVVMAVAARALLTGALHEDGLADFLDGFGGGGGDRQRTLDIMKDSRTGTFGALGLALYELALFAALLSLTPERGALTIIAADPFAKMVAAQVIMMLPYARRESEAKAKVAYRRPGLRACAVLAAEGLAPMAACLLLAGAPRRWQLMALAPCVVMYALYLLMLRRLGGYTGDCCGALFLLVELSVYVAACAA